MSEFVAHLEELFREFGPVHTRRMFGAYGVYHRGVMFALVSDDTLYLKTDARTAPRFLARGAPPFRYRRQGRLVALSYHMIPEDLLDDPPALARWAREAYAIASR